MMLSAFSNPTAIRAAILTGIINIRSRINKVKLPKKLLQQLDAEDAVINGYPLLDFLFDQNNLTEQPFPKITLPLFKWHGPVTTIGPKSDFDNITCGEYEDAEIFFLKFKQDPTPESLAHLAAILWRPAGRSYISFLNNKRIEYNADKMVPRFMKLPPWQLYTIFCWYAGCRAMLPKIFPLSFKGGGSSAAPDYMAFTKCIHAGAGTKNGSRDQIRMMPLKEFFFDMELEIKKAEEENRKNKKQ